jgi:hypothetical protein
VRGNVRDRRRRVSRTGRTPADSFLIPVCHRLIPVADPRCSSPPAAFGARSLSPQPPPGDEPAAVAAAAAAEAAGVWGGGSADGMGAVFDDGGRGGAELRGSRWGIGGGGGCMAMKGGGGRGRGRAGEECRAMRGGRGYGEPHSVRRIYIYIYIYIYIWGAP